MNVVAPGIVGCPVIPLPRRCMLGAGVDLWATGRPRSQLNADFRWHQNNERRDVIPYRLLCIVFASVAVFANLHPLRAAERPATGHMNPEFSLVDQVVSDSMDIIGAEAASLAIAHNGRLMYARAYGWADNDKTKPTQIDNTFRIASNTKPITAAIVRNLIRSGRIKSTTPVFQYLAVEPYNDKLGDQRLALVTLKHLLEHKGGWDKDQKFDPKYSRNRIIKEMNLDSELTAINVIEYTLTQPLQHAPGERRAYSNFGYLVLGRVIEKATGHTYNDVLQSNICRPLSLFDIRLSATDPRNRDPSEVYYPKESGLDFSLRDALGGLASSASSLCAFMQAYWINGEVRNRTQRRSYYHFGSHPNSTTALKEQRIDGIDYVLLFNSRRNDRYKEDDKIIQRDMNLALDQIKRQSR